MEIKPTNNGDSSGETSKSPASAEAGSSRKSKKVTRVPLGLGKSFMGGEFGESSKNKDSKDADGKKSIESSAAVNAWRNLVKKTEAVGVDESPKQVEAIKSAEAPSEVKVTKEAPVKSRKEAASDEETSQPEKLADVIDLEAYRRSKAEREAKDTETKPESDEVDSAAAQAEVPKIEHATETNDNIMEYPIAVGAEPPMGPPPVGWAGESRAPAKRAEHLRSVDMNAENDADANETNAGEANSDNAENSTNAENAAAQPVGGEARSSRAWSREQPAAEAAPAPGDNGPEGPAEPAINERMAWFMNNRNETHTGDERTSADVRRAAARGLLVGWLVGRRGKNKAVKKAVEATKRKLQSATKKWTFWKPDYNKYNPERFKQQPASKPTAERPTASSAWLKPETKSPAANRLTAERMASTPLVDALALPAAVAATRMRAERSRLAANAESIMDETQLVDIARTIKVDGMALHQIYESHQIDTEGLRAVVAAYLRGENVEKQLNREITEKQKSFERDPYSRRRDREEKGTLRKAAGSVGDALVATGAGLAQGSQFVASKVGQGVSNASSSVRASVNSNASSTTTKAPASVSSRPAGNESNSSVIGVVAVVIIYALILVLWLTR